MKTERAGPPPTVKRATPLGPPLVRDRPVDQAAEQAAKLRLLPRPPGKKLTFDEMQTYFALLSKEMWSHVTIYVYREHPRILRKLKNPENTKYIDCLSQPIDMEYMIGHHGGGRYNLMVVDTEAKINSEQNKLFEVDFEINESKHEPKLNYEELDVNAKQNLAYVQLLQHRGILDTKGQIMATQPNAAAGVNAEFVKQVLDFAKDMSTEAEGKKVSPSEQSLNKSVGDILLEKMKQDDPNKQLTGFLAIVEKLLTTNKPADGSTQVLEKVIQIQSDHHAKEMQMQSDNNKMFLQLFEKATDPKRNADAPNPQIEQFRQIFELTQEVANFRGGGGRRSGWDIGLDYAEKVGVPIAQWILNSMTLRNGRGAIPMPPVTGQPTVAPQPAAAFDPYANPAALRAHANALAVSQPPPAPTIAPTIEAPPGMSNEIAGLVQNYGGLIVSHLDMGTRGWQFADLMTGMLGQGMHAQIVAHGESALLQALLSFPETNRFGEQRLRTFVTEFVNFQEFLETDEDESDTTDAPSFAATARGGVR